MTTAVYKYDSEYLWGSFRVSIRLLYNLLKVEVVSSKGTSLDRWEKKRDERHYTGAFCP